MRNRLSCTSAFVAVLFCYRIAVCNSAALIPLGDLPGGSSVSHAIGMSADGMTVVGYGSGPWAQFIQIEPDAFRWTQVTGMLAIPVAANSLPTGRKDSYANGASADGSYITGYILSESTGDTEAFRWNSTSQTSIAMGDLPGGQYRSRGNNISADGGVVVGVANSASGSEAFRTTGNTIQTGDGLGDLPGGEFSSTAWAGSADGSIVVGEGTSTSGREAFRWRDGVMTPLGDLAGGGFGSAALGISAIGNVIVGWGTSSAGSEAFRWENGTMTPLGDFPGGFTASRAWDTSADGSIVVGRGYGGTPSPSGNFERAFIWDAEHGMRELQQVLTDVYGLGQQLVGWTLLEATAISDNGRVVVGFGNTPSGSVQAWLAILTLPGDFNVDGMVDAADLSQWKGDFGVNGRSDADGDGDSDGADFLIWQRNLGMTSAAPVGVATPEPPNCLLALAVLAVLGRRR
jgi:probable HAF family extracellular repeat protein